jgi:hypothetical protein
MGEKHDPVRALREERLRYEGMQQIHDMVGKLQGADEDSAAFKYLDGLIKLLRTENDALYAHIGALSNTIDRALEVGEQAKDHAKDMVETIQNTQEILLYALGRDKDEDVPFLSVIEAASIFIAKSRNFQRALQKEQGGE